MGRFYAVGVGPGDPELLTLKAVRIIQRAHVVYHAGPQERQGRAWDVIRSLIRPEQPIRLVLSEPMHTVSAADGEICYRPAVEQIAADCRRGLDVVYVAEGDPTLYSTAARVWQLLHALAPEIPIEIVPGVSSISAAAARVGWPLAQKDEMLAIVPANYHQADLANVLETFPSLCLLKPSGSLPHMLRGLEESGRSREAVYVENVGTAREWITHDMTALGDRKSYFALMLVRKIEQAGKKGTVPLLMRPPTEARSKTGKIWVIGLGPGDPRLLTCEAKAILQKSEIVIGYEAYLPAIAPLCPHAELRGSPIGAEAERAALALELAETGRRVALVSSGDAGIYGMASLLLETATKMPGLDVEIVPGVTAATAAASRLGAPLGHDFACVSLSDLLTPWVVIERRLVAAGHADFVVVLYNPVSQRRTWQLPRAREILLRYRRPQTPVGLVDKAFRPGERAWQTTLADLRPDGVSMETTLIIGNSQTSVIDGRMVTPRGYSDKARAKSGGPRPAGELDRRADCQSAPQQTEGLEIRPTRQIMQESFSIIERELGPHSFPAWAFAVVRRMIHASADFEFAQTLRYSADFETAFQTARREGAPMVTDTEMVLVGIRRSLANASAATLACCLNESAAATLAASAGLTRSAAGVRLAARRYPAPLLVLGNAPTAVEEAVRLVEEEGWRPAAIIGMPVGFVGVEEAKNRLLTQSRVPYLTCVGRKGGSAVTAAAVNALVELSSLS